MRIARLAGIREIEVVEVETPAPGPGEVLVQIEAAATCGTDLKAWRLGHPLMPPPTPFGHEWVGTIVCAGDGAKHPPGRRVTGLPSAPCGDCDLCRRGRKNLCAVSRGLVLGAYAEYLLVPERVASVHLFETDLPPERAVLLEPLACVLHALRGLAPRNALVLGAGTAGLLATAALAEGGAEVSTWARREARRRLAAELGAARTDGPDRAGASLEAFARGEHDLVFDTTNDTAAQAYAAARVARGGTVVLYAGPPKETYLALDLHRLHYDGIELRTPFHLDTEAGEEALRFLGEAKRPLERIVTNEASLEDLPRVFEALAAGEGVKCLIRPGTA